MDYKYIIWDWNGTLLCDVSASLRSVNDMLRRRNMPEMDIERYRDCIGVPIIKFYERVFDLEKEDYAGILREYNEGYMLHLAHCTLSPGSIEALDYFKANGCLQIIVSSSNNEQLVENVRKYGVYDYFDAVLGSSDYFAQSKIERAKEYLEAGGEGKALVIGDLEHDADMANEIGADCILLTSGHEKRERLIKSGAGIIDSLFSLDKIL